MVELPTTMLFFSSKGLRLLAAGCVALVLFNIHLFFFEHSEGRFEFKLSNEPEQLQAQQPVPAGAPPPRPIKGRVLRKYFDDRKNGVVVLALHAKTADDEDDAETNELQNIYQELQDSQAEGSKNPFYVLEIYLYDTADIPRSFGPQTLDGLRNYAKFANAYIRFMELIMTAVDESKPDTGGINNNDNYQAAKDEDKFPNREGRVPVYGGHWREQYTNEPVRTKEFLLYFLRPGAAAISALRRSHQTFLEKMPKEYPKELYDVGKEFGFMEGDGIVYLGGGRYNQLVLTSLSLLRALGSKLPVEVILPERKDFDLDLCNNILPTFNGRCKVMTDYIPRALVRRIGGFQLKNVALLVSSFRNILYLDADNLPVKNPDYLFVNEPFKSSRMIMWPDLWRRSTSPHFYDIAGISYDTTHRDRNSYFGEDERGRTSDPAKFSFHDCKGTIPEASSETGQMMIDKQKHMATLVLSMYYNFYGPDYYYPLLSQGAAGEGDKETFIAAAHKLELPYYQVNEFNREFGPLQGQNKHEFFGMGQYDPIVDFLEGEHNRRASPEGSYAEHNEDSFKSQYNFHYYKSSSLMFMHANWPKFYVKEMFTQNSHGRGPLSPKGDRRRLYTDYIMRETKMYDFELEINRHLKLWYCDAKIELQDLPEYGSEERNRICDGIRDQIAFLGANNK